MNLKRAIDHWDKFKISFPHAALPYSKRNWGSELHSLCSFQGKMKPALAHHLIGIFSEPGDTVFDPFSGSGTIPFEAALSGRRALASDISLMAVALTRAKLRLSSSEKAEAIIEQLERHIKTRAPSDKTIKDSTEVGFNKAISTYYHPDTFDEILRARDFFIASRDIESPEWCLVFSSMLHILHGNRPYALSRRSHPITPYAPSGEFVYKSVVKHLRVKSQKSLNISRGFSFEEGKCFQGNILDSWSPQINAIDCIITSPPFAGSTRFFMTNWLRYWFAGWGKKDFETEAHEYMEVKQRNGMEVYDRVFAMCSERLRSGGIAVFHLGTNEKMDMAAQLTPRAQMYLDVKDVFTETVEHCEKHGIRDKGATTGHQYIIMQKRQ